MFIINKRVLRILSILFLAILFSEINVLEAIASTQIIPGYYNYYSSYANRNKVYYEKLIVKKEKTEVIYNPDNLREVSNLSKEQIYNMLEGNNLQALADSYYEMEQKYNINAIFLMALNIEESGNGTSSLALNKNNIGGVTSRYGGWASFESWHGCLDYIASLLDEKYLSETGQYYYGTSIYDVNVKYCSGKTWSENLNNIANQLLEKVDRASEKVEPYVVFRH